MQQIKNDHNLTKESDYEFLYHLQNSLLLALREQGRLNEAQYRMAAEHLHEQRRNRARSLMQGREALR